jgi:hypothetical protein
MTCRHAPGDPDCSSTVGGHAWLAERRAAEEARERRFKEREEELLARTPNPEEFEVAEVEEVGPHLVMMVQYSSCPKCSFDAKKVMVFFGADLKQAIRWRRIDPHFGDPAQETDDPKVAPPPRARFPADKVGWEDALEYARRKAPSGS